MRYRIKPYEYGFQIEKRRISGDNSKNPGEVTWQAIKYPRDLEHAALVLLELVTRDKCEAEDTDSVERLIDAIRLAKSDVQTIISEAAA